MSPMDKPNKTPKQTPLKLRKQPSPKRYTTSHFASTSSPNPNLDWEQRIVDTRSHANLKPDEPIQLEKQ